MSSFFSNPVGTIKNWSSSPVGLVTAPFFGGVNNLTQGLGLTPKPGQPTTSTQVNEPWSVQQPYLQALFGQAQGLNQQNPYSLVPQLSSNTMGAINTMGNGIPGYSNLTDLTNQTLQGDYLNANPYLDQTYQRGVNQIKGNVSSMFGHSRFGSGAMANATTSALENLANDIYGGNYQAERGRQQQMAALAPSILAAPAQYQLQAGQLQDQYNQQRAMAPWNQLGLYQGAITGNYGGTQTGTQTNYTNPMAGFLGGAIGGGMLANSAAKGSFMANNPWLLALGGGLLGTM